MAFNLKKTYFNLLMLCLIIIASFLLGELFLRLVPIPGVGFNTAKFDEVVGYKFYPNSVSTYRNLKGDYITRKVNQWGYLDIDHKKEKKKNVFRIGFFGDSFTESKQVPIDSTFFRLINSALKQYNVECLAFGVSGYSTLQSYLTSLIQTELFDLDLAVYVFFDNDLSDNLPEINKSNTIPYAVLTGDGRVVIDNSFREINKYKKTWYFEAADFITANSLLASTISQRIKLLLRYETDLKLHASQPPYNYNPLWNLPDQLHERATRTGQSIIAKWKRDIENNKRYFAIIYVPNQAEWKKPLGMQNSWRQWLITVSMQEKIDFIDPTDTFMKYDEIGDLYSDHFTVIGHEAFAEAFVNWYTKWRVSNNILNDQGM